MKTIPANQTSLETLKRLSTALLESPIQFMSADEQEGFLKLSEAEFLARVEKYVKNPEVDVPSDTKYRSMITTLLAKMYAKGLEASVVKKYVPRITPQMSTVKPLKPGAKKRKLAELRRKLKPTTLAKDST